MLNFRPGQRLEVELEGYPKSGYVKVKKVLGQNEMVLSQTALEKEKFPLYPNTVVRIFSEEGEVTEVLQGVIVGSDESKFAGMPVDEKETLYCIKNIFRKERHPRRNIGRLNVKLPAEVTWVSGPFSRRIWKATTANVSLKGLGLILNEEPPKVGSEIAVTLVLDDRRAAKLKGVVRGFGEMNPFGVSGAISGHEYLTNLEISRISDQDYIILAEFLKERQ